MTALGAAMCNGIGAQGLPGDGWYTSDSLGMAHEQVAGPGDAQWTLERTSLGATHRATLFKDGVAIKTTLSEYRPSGTLEREAIEENGILVEESTFDADGRPLVERRFLSDGTVDETSYEYVGGRLLSRQTSRGGSSVETMYYVYAPDGRLVSAKASSGVFYGSGKTAEGISSMWRKGPDGLELRGYDAAGRLSSIRVYDGSRLLSDEIRVWAGDHLERSTIVTSDGTRTLTEYSVSGASAGSVLTITVDRDGLIVSSQRNSYDDSGRLQRQETELGDKRISTEYVYDSQGMLALEKRFLDLDQMLVIRYESKTDKVEETYLKDVLFARVSYQDGRRVKEELFKDGMPVRTRKFE